MFVVAHLLVLAALGFASANPLYGYPGYSYPGYSYPGYSYPGYPAPSASSSSAAAAPTSTAPSGSACSSYIIIDTRGTGEPQGQSSGFTTMNSNIMRQVSGGSRYDTVYPASFNQDSSQATRDIVNHVKANTNTCYILEGYSQGAAATVAALSQLTGASFDAVRGVILLGDPDHKSGLACNVDDNGGTTTKNVNGISSFGSSGVPSNWVSKTIDVCIKGDGVCDTTDGSGITSQHLQYPRDSGTQTMGANFAVAKLKGQ